MPYTPEGSRTDVRGWAVGMVSPQPPPRPRGVLLKDPLPASPETGSSRTRVGVSQDRSVTVPVSVPPDPAEPGPTGGNFGETQAARSRHRGRSAAPHGGHGVGRGRSHLGNVVYRRGREFLWPSSPH